MKRLITFLGTGRYQQLHYTWPEWGDYTSELVAEAIASLWRPDELWVLATDDAWALHGEDLRRRMHALDIECKKLIMPHGRDQGEQWEQFETLQDAMAGGADVLLDITHGFRAQPFMAGAALAVRRALDESPGDVRVVYAEHLRETQEGKIWDLSLFAELVDWANALGLFLRTGVAGSLVAQVKREHSRQKQQVLERGGENFPTYGQLTGAIEAFSEDLATVRVAALVTGYKQDNRSKASARSSSTRLLEEIKRFGVEVQRRVPPLALILERLEAAVRPLCADQLHSPEGRLALAALARHYVRLERYPEAAIVAREASINRHASSADAVEINSPDYSDAARREAESRYARNDPDAKSVADIRNNLGHGGFRRQPLTAKALKQGVSSLVDNLNYKAGAMHVQREIPGRIIFVSRHPGARVWAGAQGIEVDEFISHLNLDVVSAVDTVVGSLPVHVAAKVCARGARYLHLALEVPIGRRGEELSAEELDRFGARLEEFRIEAARREN